MQPISATDNDPSTLPRCGLYGGSLVGRHHLASWAVSLDAVLVATAAKRWKALTFASTVWRRWLPSLPSDAVQLGSECSRRLTLPGWIVLVLCLLTNAGCRGCFVTQEERLTPEELQKRAREQKEALQVIRQTALPADSELRTLSAKPGHWIQTEWQVKSNREDLQVIAMGDLIRGENKILNISGTNVHAEFTRNTILPKGQLKTIDLQYYIPTTTIPVDPNNTTSTALQIRSKLLSRSLLTPLTEEISVINELKHPEFMIVVLSPKPLEYAYLSATDLSLWRGSDLLASERPRSYQTILCNTQGGKLPFPSSMLTLTAAAVIVWDDLSPDDLSEDQKTAILDWVHWGGQLVINGPGSWSRLRNSFLAPYLPIKDAEDRELATNDLSSLNAWVTADATGGDEEKLEITGPSIPDCEWL